MNSLLQDLFGHQAWETPNIGVPSRCILDCLVLETAARAAVVASCVFHSSNREPN